MIAFFKILIYIPLYNLLILILNVSFIDAGIATIILTVLVKVILYPLAKKSTVTQTRMKEKQEQAVKLMELYKTNKINPFSSILILIIQIPIILSLYYIFLESGLPNIDTGILYSFIKAPGAVSMNFLGLIDVSQKSLVLAFLAAASSFWQMHLASKSTNQTKASAKAVASKEDFGAIMSKQMKYTMPLIVFFISWKISGVVALYWLVSNLVGIAQDVYVRKHMVKTSIAIK